MNNFVAFLAGNSTVRLRVRSVGLILRFQKTPKDSRRSGFLWRLLFHPQNPLAILSKDPNHIALR